MTLEDFFTLTEMKDGLTAPSRVQELVSVMQKEKDSVVKNVGDMTRQWAAVASTITATENKDCLNLFIQLDGLWFINRWLKDAQNFGIDTNDGFIDESITALLRAVEKLHLDCEKSVSSGIWQTVKNLLRHQSSRVQDGARVLFDSWKVDIGCDADPHVLELVRVNDGNDKIVREEGRSSALIESGNDNDQASGIVGGEKSSSRSIESLLPERIASVQIQSSDSQLHSSEDVNERLADHPAKDPSSVQDVAPINEELPLCCVGETTSSGTISFPGQKQGSVEGQSDVLKSIDLSKKETWEQNSNSPPEKLQVPEISLSSSKLEAGAVSKGASDAKALEPVKEHALHNNVENNVDAVCHKITASGGVRTPASDKNSGVDDTRTINFSSQQLFKTAEKDDDCYSNALQDSSVSGNNLGKPEVLETSFSGAEYVRAIKEGKGHVSSEGEDTTNGYDSIKPKKGTTSPNIIEKKSSDIELEYGIVDALEVARQVAQEVEREVRSSSSEKISEGGFRQPDSPDSVRKEDAFSCVPPEEVPSRQSHSAEEEGHVSISDNIEAEPECMAGVKSLQVTEAAQDPGGNSEKSFCAFDLNEEVGSDDMDVSLNATSAPIPVVSASKPAATPGLPVAPLQFEGTLGWKGSAATSAFRPASPRKNTDGENNLFVGGNSDNSKQREDCLDIDLNVAEGEDGSGKQTTELSGLPSGKFSVEISPKGSNRLELDLNRIGDDGDAQPSEQRMEGQFYCSRDGQSSPSPASSSSSMQPLFRNIDLNDRPFLQTDLVDHGPSKSSHITEAYGGSRSDAPVISIFGTKLEVGRRDFVPQTLSLPNGKAIEPAMDLTMSRAGGVLGIATTVSYNHSPVFGYNGLTSAPTLSFSSAMYGSGGTIPYMVDSRGAAIVPQVVGTSSTVLSSYSQSPFIMSGAQLSLNGVGPSRPNFDLNSGPMIEGGNRDMLTARQFLFPGQSRAMEEHVRTIPQPSSSGMGGKRKEPDSGWETYPFSYKQPQPPWN